MRRQGVWERKEKHSKIQRNNREGFMRRLFFKWSLSGSEIGMLYTKVQGRKKLDFVAFSTKH